MDKRLILVLICLVSLLGCGGEQDSGGQTSDRSARPSGGEAKSPPVSVAAAGKPWDPALGTATITGTVKFDGKKPRMRPIDMAGADAKCAEAHGGKRVKPETVILNDNGTLRNVFVWVKSGVEGWSFPMPEGNAMLDQKGCMYTPHVQGMRQGQTLAIKTSDPTAHNVHGFGLQSLAVVGFRALHVRARHVDGPRSRFLAGEVHGARDRRRAQCGVPRLAIIGGAAQRKYQRQAG